MYQNAAQSGTIPTLHSLEVINEIRRHFLPLKPSPQTIMKVSISYTIKKGVLLLLLTAVLWSLGGLWVKFIDWNPVAIAGARSLVAFLVIAALMPEALSRLSWSAVPGALAYASVMFLFVLATKLTTAANAVFLHYTAPIHIALIGPWLFSNESLWNFEFSCYGPSAPTHRPRPRVGAAGPSSHRFPSSRR
jgi:EamA-like transporter family